MPESQNRWMRIVVNGKAAGDPALREAVSQIRRKGRRMLCPIMTIWWRAGSHRHGSQSAAA
jgi:hypothetical protein